MTRCCSCSNRDRISRLPDTIQTYILSFLSLEDATKARFLSKQWRNLRPSLYNLSFNEQNLSEKEKNLNDFIKKVFLNVRSSDVQSFILSLAYCNTKVSKPNLNNWISFAVKHKVHTMVLDGKFPCIPLCISTCTTLTDLKLLNVRFTNITNLPRFPVLKILDLYCCTFNHYQLNHICSSSVSPLLEDFTLRSCTIPHDEVEEEDEEEEDEEEEEVVIKHSAVNLSAPNLRFLCIDSWARETIISCPNLQKMDLKNSQSIVIDLDAVSNVLVARFGNRQHRASDVLRGLRNVVKLYLENHFMEALIWNLNSSACLPEPCCSLKCLEIDFGPRNQQELDLLYHLLGSYPNLTSVSVNLKGIFRQVTIGSATSYKSSAGDGLKKLKSVEIKDFTASEIDLCLVRYVLGKADSMENMNIVYSRQIYVEAGDQMKILKKLLGFTRASPRAAVSLS